MGRFVAVLWVVQLTVFSLYKPLYREKTFTGNPLNGHKSASPSTTLGGRQTEEPLGNEVKRSNSAGFNKDGENEWKFRTTA